MKTVKLALIALITLIIAACHSSKKSTAAPVVSTPVSTPAATTSTISFSVPRSGDGIYEPGTAELTAIQAQYADVTLEKLKEGHLLYTKGACINCHEAQSIYRFEESRWKGIMDDMAEKARMNEAQKDAVYKYVLAIKATQSK